MITPQALQSQLQSITPVKKLVIAYSGGLDSHVLLHLTSQMTDYSVRAIHVHHGLQKEAGHWVDHCQQVCDVLNIPLQVEHLNLSKEKGESVEELARTARYTAFKKSVQAGEVLLTAHHQNDQAETLLLQLFRGAGVQGLAAMPQISGFGIAHLARPLLNETRESLEAYAKIHQLAYIEDPSNQDSTFDRNFLRNEIIPQLKNRWPSIDKTISRSATIQAETKHILDDIAEQDLLSIKENNQNNNTLLISGLKEFSDSRQKLLLRYWIQSSGFKAPSEKKLKHIFTDVVDASDDAQPLLAWYGAEIRRYQGRLYIMSPLLDHDSAQVISWDDPQKPLEIPLLGLTLNALVLERSTELVTIRFRQGGETLLHAKRGVTISLKNLLNEAGIPPWQRSRIPLVYQGDTLIIVVGVD
ncbi:MAG: tRNA lysidine(34) synthetase TilS [Cocleimonas sp.]|nr:tRNA lysidine(34) synthetase TilS [Cocleimonas sp.]